MKTDLRVCLKKVKALAILKEALMGSICGKGPDVFGKMILSKLL